MGTLGFIAPVVLRLTGSEGTVLGVLMARAMATKEQIMNLVYAARIDDEPNIKVIDVFVCKLRAKLKPFDINIQTIWGRGYAMAAEEVAKVRALYPQQDDEDAA